MTKKSMCHYFTICRAKWCVIKVGNLNSKYIKHRLSTIMNTFWYFCPKFVSNNFWQKLSKAATVTFPFGIPIKKFIEFIEISQLTTIPLGSAEFLCKLF